MGCDLGAIRRDPGQQDGVDADEAGRWWQEKLPLDLQGIRLLHRLVPCPLPSYPLRYPPTPPPPCTLSARLLGTLVKRLRTPLPSYTLRYPLTHSATLLRACCAMSGADLA
eukprot:234966-Rhodomonas_salina.1